MLFHNSLVISTCGEFAWIINQISTHSNSHSIVIFFLEPIIDNNVRVGHNVILRDVLDLVRTVSVHFVSFHPCAIFPKFLYIASIQIVRRAGQLITF
jgi:hypothetical protein